MKNRLATLTLLLLITIAFSSTPAYRGMDVLSSGAEGFTARITRDKYPGTQDAIQRDDAFVTAFIVMPDHGEATVSITPVSTTTVDFTPQDIAEPSVKYLGKMRRIPVGLLTVPMYDAATGARFDEIIVRVRFQQPMNFAEIYMDTPIYDDVLENVFLNNIDIPRHYNNCPGHYVVICPEFMAEAARPLIDYRRQMGYKVDFNLLEDIGTSHSKEEIDAFLKDKYETLSPTPDLVMLIGDEDFPDGGGLPDYSWIEPGRTPFASDNTYALFDDEDYIPDVLIGRLAIDTDVQLQTLVAKLMTYEKEPLIAGSDWLERGLMIASYLHATTPPQSALWVRELMMRSGFTDIDTLFDRMGLRITTSQVVSGFNEGISWIDYRGWGASTGWWEPEFKIPDVYTLNNSPHYPIVATVVCGTADFRSLTDPSFAEVLLHAGTPTNPKGASAVFGPSDHDTHTRYNNPINTGFFEAPFGYDMTLIGQAALFAKLNQWLYLPHERDSTVAHYFYVYNTLADPGLAMWTGVPEELSADAPDTLIRSGETFTVSVTPAISGVSVCLWKSRDTLQPYGVTDESGTAVLRLNAGITSNAKLTVWKKGYVPFQKDVFVRYNDHAIINVTGISLDDEGDGILNSGERANITVELENTGDPTPIEIWRLSSDHPEVLVTVPSDRVVAEGTFALNFVIAMKIGAHLENPLILHLCGVNGEEERYLFDIEIPYDTGNLEITGYEWTGEYAVGSMSEISFDLRNNGPADFTYSDFMAVSESPYLGIATPDLWIPDIAAGATETVSFGVVPIGVYGADARIRLEDRNGDLVAYLDVTPETGGPSGPDLAGYVAFDLTDDGYPEDLEWMDVSDIGTSISTSDDRTTVIDIPFEFGFYGDTYDQLSICSNGWVAPGAASYFLIDFYNLPIPGAGGPFGILAPYWNDLEPSLPATPYIYTYFDEGTSIFYIQYHHFNNREISDDQFFQVQIHDMDTGDDPIAFIYEASEDNQTHSLYSTVGIAAPDRRRGLEYRYDNIYSHNSTPFDGAFGIWFTNRDNMASLSGTVRPSDARVYLDYSSTIQEGNEYSIPVLPIGTHTIQARRYGYYRYAEEIDMDGPETHDIVMELVPEPLDLSYNMGTGIVSWTAPDAPGRTIEGYNIYLCRYSGGDFELLEFVEATEFTHDSSDDPDYIGDNRLDWYRVTSVIDGDESFPAEITADTEEDGTPLTLTSIDMLSLYPNPFNSTLEVRVSEGPADIEIIATDGRTVASFPAVTGSIIWTAKDMPTGIYNVRASSKNGVKSERALLIK